MKKFYLFLLSVFTIFVLFLGNTYANSNINESYNKQYMIIKENNGVNKNNENSIFSIISRHFWEHKDYTIWYSISTFWYSWQSRYFWWVDICLKTNPETPNWYLWKEALEVALYKDVFWPDIRLKTFYLDTNSREQIVTWKNTWKWNFYLYLKSVWGEEWTYDNSARFYNC